MERIIFHIDVNSAYLSWEAVRQVKQGKSDLRLIPSAIGGEEGKRTGIILAKSIPAKRYGVTTGEPVSMALRKCPNLVLLPPDFSWYKKNSEAFISICKEYAPVLQQFSIDECFLDMTGTEGLYGDMSAMAHTIKNRIRDELGFTVNVGIGSNKLLAKMASDFEKPDKVHTLYTREIQEKLWPLPVGDLLYIGKTTAQRLEENGIKTIGSLANTNPQYLKQLLGEKNGEYAYTAANGVDDSEVTDVKEDPKGYSISTTVEKDITTWEEATGLLLTLADNLTARMRADGAKAYCIGVDIRMSKIANYNGFTPSQRFTDKSHQKKLDYPTDVTDEVFTVCKELLREFWHGEPLRLMGIALRDVTREETEQISFIRDERREKSRKVDALMDSLREKYGQNAVYRAGTVKEERNRKY